jgi:hypothetical protein
MEVVRIATATTIRMMLMDSVHNAGGRSGVV